ncbi:MAG: hypothetical protein BWY88_00917 [Synergistetes bacterium ADurb.Bin520]|nr:MAG: hypothetical protein BWY88_00917 [Synergistetes bacterium ADurb.Bin520]
MRQHDALGVAGGPGGVGDGHQVVLGDLLLQSGQFVEGKVPGAPIQALRQRQGSLRGEGGQGFPEGGAVLPQKDQGEGPFDARSGLKGLLQGGPPYGQHRRPGMIHPEDDFLRHELDRKGHRNPRRQQGPHLGHDPFGASLGEDGNPVALAKAALQEPGGEAAGHGMDLGIGEGQPARVGFSRRVGPVGKGPGRLGQGRGYGPLHFPFSARWARIASTTQRWSSSWAMPDTVMAPTTPVPRRMMGKPPP